MSKIEELNNLQYDENCASLTIGCADTGGKDFLDGSGRIRSIDINQNDQPFVASYTIVVAIETINGQPVVQPDPEFAKSINIPPEAIPKFLTSYSESITIDGSADLLCANDQGMGISKGYIKANGSIELGVNSNFICGYPSYDPMPVINNFLLLRSASIINGYGDGNPLINYRLWNKFLDTKSLEIKTNGNVSWQFTAYVKETSGGTPSALVTVNTTDNLDQKTKKRTRSISGNIKGLSLATIGDHIGHKANTNERIGNAQSAFDALDRAFLHKGVWPGGEYVTLTAPKCPPDPNTCDTQFIPPICYQRNSHTITKSMVAGEITFDMDFSDIDACKSKEYELEITIDDTFPAHRYQEIIIPNRAVKGYQAFPRSIIQRTGVTSQSVRITVRASLIGCDAKKMEKIIECAKNKLNFIIASQYSSINGWIYKSQTVNKGTYSITITHERIRCNYYA